MLLQGQQATSAVTGMRKQQARVEEGGRGKEELDGKTASSRVVGSVVLISVGRSGVVVARLLLVMSRLSSRPFLLTWDLDGRPGTPSSETIRHGRAVSGPFRTTVWGTVSANASRAEDTIGGGPYCHTRRRSERENEQILQDAVCPGRKCASLRRIEPLPGERWFVSFEPILTKK